MRLGLLTSCRAARAAERGFRYLTVGNLLAACFVVAFGELRPVSLAALLFIGVATVVNLWPRYRGSPFSLIASVTTSIYFVAPLVFMSLMGDSYEYGRGLAVVPDVDYARIAPASILFMVVCLAAVCCGVACASARRTEDAEQLTRGLFPEMPIGLLAVIVLLFTVRGNESFILTQATGEASAESLWQFLFFDHAYLILLPLIVAMRQMRFGRRGLAKLELELTVLLLSFLVAATMAGSKGFILVLFLLSFVLPISYLKANRSALCFVPSRTLAVFSGVMAVGVFPIAYWLRVSRYQGGVTTAMEGLRSAFGYGGVRAIAEEIAYRMAAGVDRYLLLCGNAISKGYDFAYAQEYMQYLAKNFLNLVLPGTPFPECYTPSSNLFHLVLFREPLFGETTAAALTKGLNTQPYTLFGVAVIASGIGAPVLLLVLSAALAVAYRWCRSVPVRLGLLYLLTTALLSYGAEVVVANALHLGVSLVVFVYCMRYARRLRWLLPRASRPWRPSRRQGLQGGNGGYREATLE